jgi:hypothetical protein
VHYGQTRIVEVLLARGADVEARDDAASSVYDPLTSAILPRIWWA